jgi:hypothetical protein
LGWIHEETPDTVGDHEFAVNDVIESFGGFLKILSRTVNGIDLPPARDTFQDVTATRPIQTLRDTLWYVKESHLTLSERECIISALFRQFNGYDKPEQHKHRKWIATLFSIWRGATTGPSYLLRIRRSSWVRAEAEAPGT